jgi:hypothetical protein
MIPVMKTKTLHELAFNAARAKGLIYPVWAHNSSGEPTIVDSDSGKVYRIEIKVKQIR